MSTARLAAPRPRGKLVSLLALLATSTACVPIYNGHRPDPNGIVGVTVDAHGDPVLVAELCHGDVTHVGVSGPNRGNRPNRIYAELTARSQTSSFTLNLIRPSSGWTGKPLAKPLTDSFYFISAGGGDYAKTFLVAGSFSPEQLASIRPGTVLYSVDDDGGVRRVAAGRLHQLACTSSGSTNDLSRDEPSPAQSG